MRKRLGLSTMSVLHAVADGVQYGFDIIDATGLPSGTVYPVLGRLERDGLVRSTWEAERAAHADGRPARRYYRVTPTGAKRLAEAVDMYRLLMPSLARPRGKS